MVIFTEGHQSKCIDGIWRDSGIIGYCLLYHSYGLSYNDIAAPASVLREKMPVFEKK